MRHPERIATTAILRVIGVGIGAWAVEVPRIKKRRLIGTVAQRCAFFFALGALIAMPLAGKLAPLLCSGRATGLLAAAFVINCHFLHWSRTFPAYGLPCLRSVRRTAH
jgi:hypothetical protein